MQDRKNTHRRSIRRSNHAKLDLIQIWLFIAQDNPFAADKLLMEMNNRISKLVHTPGMGRSRNEVKRGLHSFPVAKYVIFYIIEEDGIMIVRVLHSARDVKSAL